ncbi:monothiol glutaredoxin-S2-like [Coffea eugenioides]|uniref:monothiol glutaredoxin-S2-like n=1 Tax=Coffea eugenioides TaxID=49369 RepID=UPI000F5D18AC|nr:monothiol glutaredoxin-S2-like [Coffea arabica]XP_027179958.1 monothiol glutaredoxin-S2-like [Coffea eugenioides]
MDIVMRLGSEKPVVIFSKSNCGISHAIKMLICGFGANPTVYELDQHPVGTEMENALLALGCHPSVPAVFIGKQFVGGSNEVMDLNVQGKLKPLLIKARAIWM